MCNDVFNTLLYRTPECAPSLLSCSFTFKSHDLSKILSFFVPRLINCECLAFTFECVFGLILITFPDFNSCSELLFFVTWWFFCFFCFFWFLLLFCCSLFCSLLCDFAFDLCGFDAWVRFFRLDFLPIWSVCRSLIFSFQQLKFNIKRYVVCNTTRGLQQSKSRVCPIQSEP